MDNKFIFDWINQKSHKSYLLFFCIALIIVLFHGSVINSEFRFDDGHHLFFSARHEASYYLLSKQGLWAFSRTNLTPVNPWLYDIAHTISGVNPAGYYALHLTYLLLAAFGVYLVTALYCRPVWALLSTIVFLAGAPIYHVTNQLTVGHYLVGLVAALFCYYSFVLAYQSNSLFRKFLLMGLSSFLYFFAMICKEVYATLPLVLFVISNGSWSTRIGRMLPYAIAALSYLAIRYQVLGGLGGYSSVTLNESLLLLSGFKSIPKLLFGWAGLGWMLTLFLIIMIYRPLKTRVQNSFVFAGVLLALLLPLIPLLKFPGISQPDRYLLAIWTCVAIVTGVCIEREKSRKVAALFITMMIFSTANGTYQSYKKWKNIYPAFDHLARFLRTVPSTPSHPQIVLLPKLFDEEYMFVTNSDLVSAFRYEGHSAPIVVANLDEASRVTAARNGVWTYIPEKHQFEKKQIPISGSTFPFMRHTNYSQVGAQPPWGIFLGDYGGFLEEIRQEDNKLVLSGWLSVGDQDTQQFVRILGEQDALISSVEVLTRPDVAASQGDQYLNSGFRYVLTYKDSETARWAASRVCVTVTTDNEYLAFTMTSNASFCSRYMYKHWSAR